MGAMGRMYAKLLSDAGWKKWAICVSSDGNRMPNDRYRIYVCDLPSKYEELKREYEGM